MHVRPMLPALVVCLLGVAWNSGWAEEEAAIRKATRQYREALNRGDAAALVAAWTAEGDYADANGTVFKAVDLIKKQFPAESAADKKAPREIAGPASTIRFVTPDVAIEDGVCEFRSTGEEQATSGRYTVLWKKRNGKWLIDTVREASLPSAGASEAKSPADPRLTALAWLVGEWTGSHGKLTYEVSARFLQEDRVLERRFTVHADGRVVLVGTEYITRDPGTGEIVSCAINSGGAHDEGVWTVDDGLWTVDTMGAMADGKTLESTNVYTPHDDGTVTWTVLDAKVDDEALPDISVKLSRRPAK